MPEEFFANTDLPPEMKAIIGVFALFNRIEDAMDKLNSTPPLSKMELRMLVFLDRPKRMGALAADTFLVPSAVTPVVDSLEASGFVRRARDPMDRRAMLVELTEAGLTARTTWMDAVVEQFRELSGMDADEIPEFVKYVVKAMPGAVESGLMKDREKCG